MGGRFGVAGEVALDLRPAQGVALEKTVGVGVQIELADRFVPGHFTLLSAGRSTGATRSWRRLCRPRDSRERTVPIGTSRTSATSS